MIYTGTNLSTYINECLRPHIEPDNTVHAITCDMCLQHTVANFFDVKTIRNSHANLCNRHYATHGKVE